MPPNRIPIHNREQQEGLRIAGAFAAEVTRFIRPHVVPGRTTREIDTLVHDFMLDHGCRPPMLHLNGFPTSTCISLDDEVVHGIPSNCVISDGNLVKISLAVLVDGWHSSCARTFRMPAVSESANQIAGLAEQCFRAAIDNLSPGCSVNRVSEAIANLASDAGCGVVREYVGHGIGRELHQEPSVPGFPWRRNESVLLPTGSCFAIEPILTAGNRRITLEKNEWTVRTHDGSLSAEWKDTVLMTDDGPVVLTNEKINTENAPRFEKSSAKRKESVRKWWWPF